MKNKIFFLTLFVFANVKAAPPVISNGVGETPSFSNDAIHWFEVNQPELPNRYYQQSGFVKFEPLYHYVDNVNWSLFSLRQFKEVSKERWFRVPQGTKINREANGHWHWPVGSEVAKLISGKVRLPIGIEVMRPIELRLERKIADLADPRGNWAMATFTQDLKTKTWKVVKEPNLHIIVNRGVTPNGSVRDMDYTLTAPQACMTCHSQAQHSPVDIDRGNEYVYGINEELLTGITTIPTEHYQATPEIQQKATVLPAGRSIGSTIKVQFKDKTILQKNANAFSPYIDGMAHP